MQFWIDLAQQTATINVLLFSFLGTLAGIIAAAIPGFTILMAVVLVFPFTFAMTPLEGLATIIGVYVGGFSGGQIAGILLGIPGTPSSICTVFDGYPMAKNGRAGEALGIGIFASLIGGLIGGIVMVLFIKPVAEFGLRFGPWEIFSLVFFSLTIIATLGGKSFFKGMASGFLGLMMAMVGTDNTGGLTRFTFGLPELLSGFSLLPVLVGLFALPSLLAGVKSASASQMNKAAAQAFQALPEQQLRIPYRKVFSVLRQNWVNLIRSSLLGSFVGALPGEGGSVANFLAYDQAKRYSKHSEDFGKGCPDGVVASESGNNACAGGGLIPTLSLGIPGTAADAVLLGVLMVHSIPPGPALFKDSAMLVYGLFAVYFIAHFYMVALQLGIGSKVFLRITQCPQWAMIPIVLVMCAIGCFALNNQTFDIWLFFFLGIVGYLMDKSGYPLAPVVIGLILGGMCEENLRQAFSIEAAWEPFFTRPISGFFMALTALSVAYCGWMYWKEHKAGDKKKEQLPAPTQRLSLYVGLLFFAAATLLYIESWELPGASRWDAIGSRLIPQIVIVGTMFFAAGVIVQDLYALAKNPRRFEQFCTPSAVVQKVIVIFASLALWIALIPYAGFYVSSLMLMVGLMWYLREGRFSHVLLTVPVGTLLVVYGVFTLFLRLQLPSGFLM
jgi:putative tricarboxylic transport membrane protein